MKRCSKCKTTRVINLFVSDKNRPDGLYSICKICRKDYHLRNRARILAKQRLYNQTHKLTLQESHKRYALKRFFYIRCSNLRLKHSGQETATYVELAKLWKRQRGKCVLTGRRLNRTSAQLDHIIPVIKGGNGLVANLRWVHRDVNYAKRDLSDTDFYALCQEVVAALSHSKERT